jgi:hypothetical protein
MDEKLFLEIQSYMLPTDSVACVMLCKTIHIRLYEISYELRNGYPLIIIVKDAGMFWKDLDLEFQLKNRDRWDDFARKYYALERK